MEISNFFKPTSKPGGKSTAALGSVHGSKVIVIDDDSVSSHVGPRRSTASLELQPEKEPLKSSRERNATASISSKATSKRAKLDDGKGLGGVSFVFSGDLKSLSREEAMDKVKIAGGTVGNSVSRTTNFVVVGDTLVDGRPTKDGVKYLSATERGITILNEKEFLEKMAVQNSGASKSSRKTPQTQYIANLDSELWPDKHAPSSVKDLMGNSGIASKLTMWIQGWSALHTQGAKDKKVKKNIKDNVTAKIALLSGPPGIGKSSLAVLVAKNCGFTVTEFNASDVRSKKALTEGGLSAATQNSAISFNANSSVSKRRVIIFDEVDGMSTGDRGGIGELLEISKSSKCPIICICNDRQSQKIKTLANSSYDLRFRRPTKNEIANRCIQIGKSEGMDIELNAAIEIAQKMGNDVRQVLNFVQMWRRSNSSLTYQDVKNVFSQMEKDTVLRLNPFSATQQIFSRGQTLTERTDAYFVDYDLMPLMIQENYVASIRSNKISGDDQMARIVEASNLIAYSDVANKLVRQNMRWDLLTKQAMLNVAACIHSEGFIGNAEFSSWMGKNSSKGKSERNIRDLCVRMRSTTCASCEAVSLDYSSYLSEILVGQINRPDPDLKTIVSTMDSCGVDKEDLATMLPALSFPVKNRTSYGDLSTQQKRTFTTLYNKAAHKSQALADTEYKPSTKRKAADSSGKASSSKTSSKSTAKRKKGSTRK